jgi:hypothetical protein
VVYTSIDQIYNTQHTGFRGYAMGMPRNARYKQSRSLFGSNSWVLMVSTPKWVGSDSDIKWINFVPRSSIEDFSEKYGSLTVRL